MRGVCRRCGRGCGAGTYAPCALIKVKHDSLVPRRARDALMSLSSSLPQSPSLTDSASSSFLATDPGDSSFASTPRSHYHSTPQSRGGEVAQTRPSGGDNSFVPSIMPMRQPSLPKKLALLGKLRKYRARRNHGATSHPMTFRSLARVVNPSLSRNPSCSTIHSSVRSSLHSNGDLAATSYGAVFAPAQPGPLSGAETSVGLSSIGISREINKRLRHSVLNQHKLTNRFTGSVAAMRVERACVPQTINRTPDYTTRVAGLRLTRGSHRTHCTLRISPS